MYVTAHAVSMVLIVILKMWVNYAVDVDFKNNIKQLYQNCDCLRNETRTDFPAVRFRVFRARQQN